MTSAEARENVEWPEMNPANGGVTLMTHSVKASTRIALNGSPEPVSNIGVSLTEDAVITGGLGLVFTHPWLAMGLVLGAMLAIALSVAWFVRFIYKKIRAMIN